MKYSLMRQLTLMDDFGYTFPLTYKGADAY